MKCPPWWNASAAFAPSAILLLRPKPVTLFWVVRVPETAVKLRRLLNCGEFIGSHALSFFHLSSPDLLLGMDADPATRNIMGVLEANPTLAHNGIQLRKVGQLVIEAFAGKRIHPSWVVPGGVNAALTREDRDKIVGLLPEAKTITLATLN